METDKKGQEGQGGQGSAGSGAGSSDAENQQVTVKSLREELRKNQEEGVDTSKAGYIRLRQERKALKDELAKLKGQLASLEKSSSTTVTSFEDTPEEFIESKLQTAIEDVTAKIESKLQAKTKQAEEDGKLEQAENLVAENMGNDVKAQSEVTNLILASAKLQAIIAVDPEVGVAEAIKTWKKSKGIGGGDSQGKGGAPRPSGAGHSGNSRLESIKIEMAALDYKDPEMKGKWDKLYSELKQLSAR